MTSSFTDPVILFFLFGIVVSLMGSTLEVPKQISKFLGIYLLMSLGLKGGYNLSQSGFTSDIIEVITIGIFLSATFPIAGFFLLRNRIGVDAAAAIAATYGSVSAVTFITATQYLEKSGIPYSGYMTGVLAVMEAPSIIVALMLSKINSENSSFREVLGESFRDGSPALLLASMLIAFIGGEPTHEALGPFNFDLFKGMLCLFLLDMGITAAKSFRGGIPKEKALFLYATIGPFVHAMIALVLCSIVGLAVGNTILLMVLAASASYIAVPAVMATALPKVNKALYIGMGLGITFPINILIGIPLYTYLATLG